ncbi:ribbon-helix-helix protein, CopG family [Paraneptunicella aestuarii]|uniref:CopG family ribbon-helix-helix protein n=1 Tax=Paraneptunicella aestuarii TaxID=2831148 RepID=UPI001E493C31|nr:ribbon-helix-helix protein, CopG family [Paraneptunicella aestuarii]UAA39908.1 ribbon-helix-helix protein, CopG family [Paraneptunicella aestuarii]
MRISKDIETPLNELAEKLDRSKSYLINQAIKDYLARQAMADSRWQDTLAALKSVEDNRLVEGDKAFQWMESWGSENEGSPPKV